jgi:hypothetical protein
MRKFLVFVLFLFLFSCVNNEKNNSQIPNIKQTPLSLTSKFFSPIPASSPITLSSSSLVTPKATAIPISAKNLSDVSISINRLGFLIFDSLYKTNKGENILISPIYIYSVLLDILKESDSEQRVNILTQLGLEEMSLSTIENAFDVLTQNLEKSGKLKGLRTSSFSLEVDWNAQIYFPQNDIYYSNHNKNTFNGSIAKIDGTFAEICSHSRFFKGAFYNKSYFNQKNSSLTIELIESKVINSLNHLKYGINYSEWVESNEINKYQGKVCTILPRFSSTSKLSLSIQKLFNISKGEDIVEQQIVFSATQAGLGYSPYDREYYQKYDIENYQEGSSLKDPFGVIISDYYSNSELSDSPLNSDYSRDTIILLGLIQNLSREEFVCDINRGCHL